MHSLSLNLKDRDGGPPPHDRSVRVGGGEGLDSARDPRLLDLIRGCAELHPDKLAVVLPAHGTAQNLAGVANLSYGELVARTSELARRLRVLGVEAGDRVGLLMDRSVETIVAMCAILDLGAVYVPLDPAYPEARLRFMLEDTNPRLVITKTTTTTRYPVHFSWKRGLMRYLVLCRASTMTRRVRCAAC